LDGRVILRSALLLVQVSPISTKIYDFSC